jgi:uncharacterized protein YabN with tetrapyrrole methylase and pyrophosphatase domain
VLAGVDPALPALLYAHKLLGKAASVGIETPSRGDAATRAAAAAVALGAGTAAEPEAELAELLAAVVALARSVGLDGETALRGWAARFRERVEAMEQGGRGGGVPADRTSND